MARPPQRTGPYGNTAWRPSKQFLHEYNESKANTKCGLRVGLSYLTEEVLAINRPKLYFQLFISVSFRPYCVSRQHQQWMPLKYPTLFSINATDHRARSCTSPNTNEHTEAVTACLHSFTVPSCDYVIYTVVCTVLWVGLRRNHCLRNDGEIPKYRHFMSNQCILQKDDIINATLHHTDQ